MMRRMTISSFDHAAATRHWVRDALALLEQEATRSADTHLLRLDFPGFPDIAFYFKDESTHPTGSLKHRLARSLYLYALCNGRLHAGQTVVDASSGSDAGLHCAAENPGGASAGRAM